MTDPCDECGKPIPAERIHLGRTTKYCSVLCGNRVHQRVTYHRRKAERPAEHKARLAVQRQDRADWERRQRDTGGCVRCKEQAVGGALCGECVEYLSLNR